MADEVKTIKVDGLGEIQDHGDGVFTMDDKELYAFYEKHGIPKPKDVVNALNKANDNLTEQAVSFLKDPVIKNNAEQELRCGTGNNQVAIRLYGKRVTRQVRTGEPVTKFGVASVRMTRKVPESLRKEGGVLDTIAKEIEAALKNRR